MMIFNWKEFIVEFKDSKEDMKTAIKANLSEMEDLFEGIEDDFYYNITDNIVRVEFGSIESDMHHGFNINLQTMEMVKDSGDKINIIDIDEALDIIEKEVYNYLGISEKKINKKYENATGIGTVTPQPYRQVDDNMVNTGQPLVIGDINKTMKLGKFLKKKKRKK
jgi:hypothetical protein